MDWDKNRYVEWQTLQSDLKEDAKLIVQASAEEVNKEDKGSEISGHTVVRTLNRVWNKLKLNDYLYWT